MEKGLVLVNTGDGKGKTTAALGTAVRALGQGLAVAFIQFIKNRATGESRFLEEYEKNNPGRLKYQRLGLGFIKDRPGPADLALAAEALALAGELTTGGRYDLVVLDEICVALAVGLVTAAEVARLIETRPPLVNLILTGRGCPEEIIALADTVTEMKMVKHAYQKGLKARLGLEW
jgi:cob(I)alamin adenosyltransferase